MEVRVQAIYERSQLHLSSHISEDGHMSSEMDGEASVNDCDNYPGVSPCFHGSRATHLSVTICDEVCLCDCVFILVYAVVCARSTWEAVSMCVRTLLEVCHLGKE